MCRVLLVTRGFCGGFCKWVGKERGNQRCGRGGAFLEKRTDLWYGDEDGSRFGGCVENGPNGLCAGQQRVSGRLLVLGRTKGAQGIGSWRGTRWNFLKDGGLGKSWRWWI